MANNRLEGLLRDIAVALTTMRVIVVAAAVRGDHEPVWGVVTWFLGCSVPVIVACRLANRVSGFIVLVIVTMTLAFLESLRAEFCHTAITGGDGPGWAFFLYWGAAFFAVSIALTLSLELKERRAT